MTLIFFFFFLSIQYCQIVIMCFHMAIQQRLFRTDALKQDGKTSKWYRLLFETVLDSAHQDCVIPLPLS